MSFVGATPVNSMESVEGAEGHEVAGSSLSINSVMPLRALCEIMSGTPPNIEKKPIRLQQGDPTVLGKWKPPKQAIQSLVEVLTSGECDISSYTPSVGTDESRESVAKYVNAQSVNKITKDDVIITCGCSHSILLAIEALGDAGGNMLVPVPGFPLYASLLRNRGIEDRAYHLIPDKNWQADLKHLESLIDDKTTAIFVNNPANPCGSNWSKEHLIEILQIADKHRVTIIADEIYGYLVYGGTKFHSLESLSPKVPILQVDSLSKRFCMPGWRIGWLIIRDVDKRLARVRKGLNNIVTMKIFGPFSPLQIALPKILAQVPATYIREMVGVVERNAEQCYCELSKCVGLQPVRPSGAMYMIVNMDMSVFHVHTELDFVTGLIMQQSVYILPAYVFRSDRPGFRVVLTATTDEMTDACHRIVEYCNSINKNNQ